MEAVTRDQTLYYVTGDLVVSAPTPAGGLHLFRVHTAIISQFSPVLGDMLKLPSGTDAREIFGGVPLLHFPDPAADVGELFRSFLQFWRSDPSFPTKVYGLMRIATKYQVDFMCNAIKHHLESEWPATLGDLLRLQNDMDAIISMPDLAEFENIISDAYSVFPEPAAAIRVAMDLGTISILPAAFYMLAVHDYDHIEDKTTSNPPRELTASRFAVLKEPELLRYYQGKVQFAKAARFALTDFWSSDKPGCEFDEQLDDGEAGDDIKGPTNCENTLAGLDKQIKDDPMN
ncbi:hypothetical protein PHLGIDRAFT_118338 [Phlebiopsis gigantea 11061_1 CR5-6]|uniref:BTB domain-containing protein n=1 Tax=Phlebiopsis gigantea (strain 11061_1 CR5-6) TaxID=745531 RepID=A0A0C3SAN2_PHLG1|nr:hypothetical protein PHLGIDRAFT_118338 [Phlebiopsis gigantea 11061_1 CR5-6]